VAASFAIRQSETILARVPEPTEWQRIANLDLSVRWYREMLGFRETRRLNMPGSSLRISFLELTDFASS
jgi:hypothetical protein